MSAIRISLNRLGRALKQQEISKPVSMQVFLQFLQDNPEIVLRSVFQLFRDMIDFYVPHGEDEYPNDPESINYIRYDTHKLLVKKCDTPYFADRLFANRLINNIQTFTQRGQQNRIYIFEGPPGTGKSTFLNNLLGKVEYFTTLENGAMYETVWKINIEKVGGLTNISAPVILESDKETDSTKTVELAAIFPDDHIIVPCPSHDHPILQIPKQYRIDFLEDIIEDPEMMERIRHEKEFEWIFKAEPCTICRSIYNNLVNRLGSPAEALKMLFARRFVYNRQLGEGISVFNPGDDVHKQPISNPVLQNLLNNLFRDSNAVRYVHSRLAKTNNGIFAIMDVKNHNKDRLMNLHGIISDRVHKVEYVEEYITSLFIAIVNPEDEKIFTDVKSFQDRIVRIRMPYVLDFKTEVEIYRHMVGRDIHGKFLPRVLENFAKVIIATRMNPTSEGMKNWIASPGKYQKYCDKNLLLLKMDIYTGYIPSWVSEEDRKSFDSKKRRTIIREGETEGEHGVSGRQSIQLFINYFNQFSQNNVLITMGNLLKFFDQQPKSTQNKIPTGFLDALKNLYDFDVLQEVKEALYDYNRKQVENDVKNYLAAVSYDEGSTITSTYTGETLEINDQFFSTMEKRILGEKSSVKERKAFRDHIQKEYISITLARELLAEKRSIDETALFQSLHGSYSSRLKEHVLDPLINNENFRMAIKAFGTREFSTYNTRIRQDVELLFSNLQEKFDYSEEGAQQVCIYVLDNKLAERFADES